MLATGSWTCSADDRCRHDKVNSLTSACMRASRGHG